MALNILIINQNDDFCSMLSGFLNGEGHRASCVTGEAEVLHAVQTDRPDLIIIEVSMPEILTIETVKRLDRSSQTRHIPVIVISDFPELEFELLHIFDFINKPVDLARLRENIDILVQGGKRRLAAACSGQLTPEEHLRFHDYLITHSGLHFERRNIKMLERGLNSRMTALHINSYADYFDYLTRNRERRQELQKLLQLIAVGETFFFRYNAHFSALAKQVIPELICKGGEKRLRFWSAGCSTGEEPYSIAMAIMEALPEWRQWDIRIYATDINNRSLKQASDGVYNTWKMRVTEPRYLGKYFRKIGDSFVVRDEVKTLVDFSHLNLQSDMASPELLPEKSLDVIFCRNVMIYFTLVTTKRVVENFSTLLKPGGYLFLGHSETLSNISSAFERQLQEGGFFYRRKAETVQQASEPKVKAPAEALVRKVIQIKPEPVAKIVRQPNPTFRQESAELVQVSLPKLYERAVNFMDQEKFSDASTIFREIVTRKPEHTGAILGEGLINANSGRFHDALDCCNRVLEIDDLIPEAYYLRGLIFEMQDKLTEAVDEYRKSILLKMDFVMPHYQLGKLFFRSGDIKLGIRELKNSLKLLEKSGYEAVIPFSGGLSREVFLEQLRAEIIRVDGVLAA